METTSVLKYEITVGTEGFTNEKKDHVKNEQALVEASIAGNFEKISQLLSIGTSVDAEEYNKLLFYASKNYMTPLQLAAANNHSECVQLLIDYEADVNAKDRFDVTALHMAAEKGNLSCLKALLDAGADCCCPTKFSKSGCYRAVPHLGGTTPLHLAATNNHVECVKELIQYGADYNAVDECGRTSLYIAAQLGLSHCVLSHLKHAVGRDILSLPGLETSDTPLHFAVSHRMVECVRELLYLGSDVNHVNIVGCSPLHIALISSKIYSPVDMEILQHLILDGYNTDINMLDSGCYSPLHYVCFNGQNRRWLRRAEMAKFLIAYGANVNIKNCRGATLLQTELKLIGAESDVLKYIIRSMLHLPSIKELNISLRGDSHTSPRVSENRPPLNPTLENNILADYTRRVQSRMFPNSNAAMEMNVIMEMMPYWSLTPPVVRRRRIMQIHGENPMPIPGNLRGGFIDEPIRFNAQDGGLDIMDNDERNIGDLTPEGQLVPSVLEKLLWYEKLAINPRTLQHCCRYAIREALGSFRLKHVKKLPVPPAIHSYILLEYDE